jgi:ADP-heptose:LPS heptosyltransferase
MTRARISPEGSATLAPGAAKPERIVIFRLGSLGDTVVALPCLHKIAAAFPNAERIVLSNIPVSSKAAAIEAILANSELIDHVIDYPLQARSIATLWALCLRLRALRASTLVYLAPWRSRAQLFRDLFFFRLCGFRRILGAPIEKDLSRSRVDPATGFVEQECSRLARTLSPLGMIDLDDRASWDLRLTEQERAAGADAVAPIKGLPFIAINMGGKARQNHWGEDNWRRLFEELSQTHGRYGLLVVGAPDDSPPVTVVTEPWPGPIVNACGRLTPRESAAAMERAQLFVGHDSGPMHLAAACGVPCIGLFSGLVPPRKWHPYGVGHQVIHRKEGISAIQVDEVAALVRGALPAMVDDEANCSSKTC